MSQIKISLSVIAGNAEQYVERFLDSFQPWFDEVVMVRAIGHQEADDTLTVAAARGCITGDYFNVGHPARGPENWTIEKECNAWPHVDDFAAARNASLDLCAGDWIMWADMDDLMTEESGKQIRRLIEDIHEKEVDGVLVKYIVPEDGIVNWRERIWRRGSARWENPVHECLKFDADSKHMRFEGSEIVHSAGKRNPANDERNLRILQSIPDAEKTISQKFHTFQSLIALDRNAEAITHALDFVQTEGVGRNEKYEAFFQLARLAGDEDTKKQMLLQAVATDPNRREAYGELGLANMLHDPQSAIGWTDAMLALRMPNDPPWNLRRTYYGHLGISLRAMALRVNGRQEEADTLETNHFILHGAKISLLHATRGRAAKAWLQRMNWIRLAANPDSIEHIFAIDIDDFGSYPLANARCVVKAANTGPVGAWNAAAEASKGNVLVQMSDDFEPFPGWDTAILDAIGDTSKPAVLAVHDGFRKDELLCMAILTRARYKQQGHLFHPEFFSMYSDNHFSQRAFADGLVIDARDRITFEHMHPAFGKGEMDETYARSNDQSNYLFGQGIMRRLNEGIRVSTDVQGWCDYKDLYSHIAKTLDNNAVIAEIGSWMGQSIIHLCQRLQDLGKHGVKVHCVDTWKGEQNQPDHLQIVAAHGGSIKRQFLENVTQANVGDMVVCTLGDSAESAAHYDDASLDFIFIDAAHDYESVTKDLAAWYPKLKQNGIFAGHDYPWHEVKKAVDEHAAANGYEVASVGRCWIKLDKP